jgi:hypothetical protein
MKISHIATALTLSVALCGVGFAQSATQCAKDAQAQADSNHKVDKTQAKADKAESKAMKSHKVKKAAKKQDKADRTADQATPPPDPQK